VSDAGCAKVVLIVEDDDDVRESLAEVLKDNDYVTREATHGRDTLDSLRAGGTKPCLILLDLMMPVMDGRQFRAAQMNDPALAAIPVVVLSAHTDAAELARQMGVLDVLKKPIDLASLLATVHRFCAKGS